VVRAAPVLEARTRPDFFHTRMQAANGSRKIRFLLNIVKWVELYTRTQTLPLMTLITLIYTDQESSIRTGFRAFSSKPERNLLAIFSELCYVKPLFFNSLRRLSVSGKMAREARVLNSPPIWDRLGWLQLSPMES
jgi:hypothetical protein